MNTVGETQSTLLLLLMIFEKERMMSLLKYLEPDEADRLREQAEKLMKLPESERLQPLVSEIKTFLYHQSFSQTPIEDVDRLLKILENELPATIGLILRYLPEKVAAEVCSRLPSDVVAEIPDQKSLERISGDVVQTLRHEFQRIYFQDVYAGGS